MIESGELPAIALNQFITQSIQLQFPSRSKLVASDEIFGATAGGKTLRTWPIFRPCYSSRLTVRGPWLSVSMPLLCSHIKRKGRYMEQLVYWQVPQQQPNHSGCSTTARSSKTNGKFWRPRKNCFHCSIRKIKNNKQEQIIIHYQQGP